MKKLSLTFTLLALLLIGAGQAWALPLGSWDLDDFESGDLVGVNWTYVGELDNHAVGDVFYLNYDVAEALGGSTGVTPDTAFYLDSASVSSASSPISFTGGQVTLTDTATWGISSDVVFQLTELTITVNSYNQGVLDFDLSAAGFDVLTQTRNIEISGDYIATPDIGFAFGIDEAWRGSFGDGDSDTLSVEITSAVPLPGAVWLLASGLMGLVALRKKRS